MSVMLEYPAVQNIQLSGFNRIAENHYPAQPYYMYDGVHQVSGLRRDPAVSVEDLAHIHLSYWKIDSDPRARVLCWLFIT